MTIITSTGLRNGDKHTVTAEIDPAEIARRKDAAEARRAARVPPMPGIVFLKRFTDDEYEAIDTAAATNIQIKRWRDELLANGEVNVNGDEAQAAKAWLLDAKLLTPQRAELVFAPQG